MLLLDGATGTELARRGYDVDRPGWSAAALIDAPELVAAIHRDYAAAGADIITANTFRTHARSLAAIDQESRAAELTQRAVALARSAAGTGVRIAGSQAPLEDCYRPELVPPDAELAREHRAHARHLAETGVDLILVETMNTIREAAAAAQAATATGLPVMVSFVCGLDGRLLSGESLESAAAAIMPLQPAAILVNCLPATSVAGALSVLRSACGSIMYGAYANAGVRCGDTWESTSAEDPEVYAQYVRHWIADGAQVVGGCCGTTPAHIAAVKTQAAAGKKGAVDDGK